MSQSEQLKKLIELRDEVDRIRDELLGVSWKIDCFVNYLHAEIQEKKELLK